MGFKKGEPRPLGAGRKKGSVNLKKVLKLSDYLKDNDINISKDIYETIMQIDKPSERAKALLDLYRFVDAPVKEKDLSADEPLETQLEETTEDNLLAMVLPNR